MGAHFPNCTFDPCKCDYKRYKRVFCITLLILILEIIGGIMSGSLALFADAGHVFTDLFAVIIAMVVELGVREKGRPENEWRAIGGYLKTLLLLVVSIWIIIEAIDRLHEKIEVISDIMIVVAAIGGTGNFFQHKILSSSEAEHVTHKGLSFHVLSDLWQSIAVVVTGVVIALTGLFIFDIVISIIIAVVFLFWSIKLFRMSGNQLKAKT